MRKLMWFAIGFAAACAAAVYLLRGRWLLPFFLICLTIFCFTLIGSSSRTRKAGIVLLGCAAAFLWTWIFYGLYLSDLKTIDGETLSVSTEITDYSTSTDYGISADGIVKINGKPYRIRVYAYEIDNLQPGDVVRGNVRFRLTSTGKQPDTSHGADGILLLGYLNEEVSVVESQSVTISSLPAILRREITTLLDRIFPVDTLPFARALLLGDRTLLEYETNTALSLSGIRHVVAVSGLHVSILFSVVFFIFGYRRVITPVVGWLILFIFAAITGFTPSVMRACVMHGLMLGGLMLQKEYDAPTALAFAVLVMLTVNPLAVTSIGLQLSVGCVVGIFLFSERIRKFILSNRCLGTAVPKTLIGTLKKWIADSTSITLSTLITTTPLSAAYFGAVSLISILTNILTLWVVTIIFCGLLVASIAGVIYAPAGGCIAWMVSWLIRYVLIVAKFLASLPMAAVYTASVYIVIWIIFCYILLVAFVFSKKKRPWLLSACVIMGLFISVFVSWLEPRLDSYRLTVLDVGQGQCILVQQDGKNYMVDCGGNGDQTVANTASQLLLSQGIRNLDGIILTHYDTDHAGAAENLLKRISVDTLYLPDMEDPGSIRHNLASVYSDKICWIAPESSIKIPDIGLTLYSGNYQTIDNESSLCILFQSGNCDILITGDRNTAGEKQLLNQVTLPDLEVLVVGHHGSKDATGLELLTATYPDIAIVSAGENNDYGHPADAVLERLEIFNCHVLCTNEKGTIVVRG